MIPFPDVRVGEPHSCGSLAVFPLFHERLLIDEGASHLDYVLAQDAMALGNLTISEVSVLGVVGSLLVDNGSDDLVLLLEGEELRGAKQNRMVNISILVAPRGTTTIPVTCTERRRWQYGDSRDFAAGAHCPPTMRYLLMLPRLIPGLGRHEIRSQQVSMWHEIQRKHCALGVLSQTDNLSDAVEAHRPKVDELRTRLPYPEGASGIAVAIGGSVVSIDLFDQPTTLAQLWDRFALGIAMDALEVTDAEQVATATDVTAKLYSVRRSAWEPTPAVGLGESYFTKAADGAIGTALVVDGHLVHGSVSMPRFPAGTFSGDLG
jgi:hypothetical protein